MNNIHTLDSLNNNNSVSNSNTITLTPDSVNDGSQLFPVLKLRASNEFKEVQSSLDRVVEEHLKYYEENGCFASSLSESFPSLYPAAIEDEITVTSLFDIIKNIYNRFINSGVDIDENNINTLSNLIRMDPSSDYLTEEIKEVLNNVVSDLNITINTNNLKPLGQFGDITLNELILKGQNLDFSFLFNNQEFIVYPLKLIPIGIVYGTIVRLFMKHCDDYNSIKMEKNALLRAHFLRLRRINIATTLAITAPIATILFLKFGSRLGESIFDGIKIGVPSLPTAGPDKDKIVTNELINSFIPIFTIFASAINKNKNKNKYKYPLQRRILFLYLFLFIIICVGLYNYNPYPLGEYINSNIIIYLLCYIWLLILIFTLVYNSLGYFLFLNKNDGKINIDLKKIRIKFIRNTINDFIVIRNNTTRLSDKEKMRKYFLSHLYWSLFLIILSFLIILI